MTFAKPQTTKTAWISGCATTARTTTGGTMPSAGTSAIFSLHQPSFPKFITFVSFIHTILNSLSQGNATSDIMKRGFTKVL
jgi:hypothetical protein